MIGIRCNRDKCVLGEQSAHWLAVDYFKPAEASDRSVCGFQ